MWGRQLRPAEDLPALMPYVGFERGVDKERYLYAPLTPVSVFEMNDAYRERGFAFIGLTPRFGGMSEIYRVS
jgi:hypothetical protein